MSIWYRGDPRGKKIKSRSKGDSEIKRQIKQSKKEGEKTIGYMDTKYFQFKKR